MKGYGRVYKWVEVKKVNGNAKSFLCVWEMKSLEILNQMKQIDETNSSLKTLNK